MRGFVEVALRKELDITWRFVATQHNVRLKLLRKVYLNQNNMHTNEIYSRT